jgi:predicted ArsR family transcriptional regulator
MIIITGLTGVPGHEMIWTPDERLTRSLDSKGVERDLAASIMDDLLEEELVVYRAAEPLGGEKAAWALTEEGVRAREWIYDARLCQALETLGELELRHENVIKAADRCHHSSRIADAWEALYLDWDIAQTVHELAEVELLSDYTAQTFEQFGRAKLGLSVLGMRLVRERGWSRYKQAA